MESLVLALISSPATTFERRPGRFQSIRPLLMMQGRMDASVGTRLLYWARRSWLVCGRSKASVVIVDSSPPSSSSLPASFSVSCAPYPSSPSSSPSSNPSHSPRSPPPQSSSTFDPTNSVPASPITPSRSACHFAFPFSHSLIPSYTHLHPPPPRASPQTAK